MPNLRVVTWNSGGEAGGRGAALAAAAAVVNGTPPPVGVVTIQEARATPGGSIRNALVGGAGPFAGFTPGPDNPRERNPVLQPYGVGVNKAYLESWRSGGAMVAPLVVAGPAAARIPLNPVIWPANGVETYIQGVGAGPAATAALRLAAANIRPPVRKQFTIPVGGGAAAPIVYFYSWHAELQANWLGVSWATVGLWANPFAGPGMYPAFRFFQASDTFQADRASAAGNPNNVVIIAGDLNIKAADLAHATMFPNFVGVSSNLSHILAFSSSGNLNVVQGTHFVTPYPPHAIVSAEVQW